MNFKTNHQLVLASASPRRKELFSKLGIPFEVISSNVEETSVRAEAMDAYVREVALLKARDVAKKEKDKTIIGADTVVTFEGTLLHKPKNAQEAITHLTRLSEKSHLVMTAVVIILPDGAEEVFVEETKVHFKKLNRELIESYVETGDPFDKAGGYGIQTDGVFFVDHIVGDYNNVVGLPLASLFEKLVALNILKL
ncbi:Maf family protein [Ureibacillus sinduriensis]|uniref:dTTP/UTP pyrophosphatase n=1 Tax=Ureibacillus sinduriensis BLB-1 = JCM 15800 TaxID=1384057 RepID=A0A0A3HVU0_9BACL|nr:Maf family protein [Ureibacillus sinduriensis]KGR74428.1 septum formation inhibitor Maf [Ureibacillus sinduriensis BLB-1 = JCM 15800]